MEPGRSRLLIAEMCLPDEKADIEAVWYDITMLTLNGRERTRADWAKLLDVSGLSLEKVYTATGSNYGVVEAYLK
jgi:hypothetical protein